MKTKPGTTYEDLCRAASEAHRLIDLKSRGVNVEKQLRAVESRIFEVS